MGVALPRPSGRPNLPGKFFKNFLGHKLLDHGANIILKNYPNLNFAENGCGPATPLRKTQHAWKNFSSQKLLGAKRILKKYETLVAY